MAEPEEQVETGSPDVENDLLDTDEAPTAVVDGDAIVNVGPDEGYLPDYDYNNPPQQ